MNKNIARQLIKYFDKNAILTLVDKELKVIEFEIKDKNKYSFQWYKISICDLLKILINNRWLKY